MNLAAIIDGHPDDDPALITAAGDVTTYGQLRAQVDQLQRRLSELGIGPDDRVALLCANHPAFVVGYLAVLRMGAVAVPLNTASPPAELQRELGPVEPAAILVGPGASELARAIESTTGVQTIRLSAGVAPVAQAQAADAGDPPPVEPPAGDPSPVEPAAGDPPPVEPAAGDPPLLDRQPTDVAALLFTAGTAGTPRAAMLTHGNLLANLDQVRAHPGWAMYPTDRVLAVLPLCHVFGLNTVLGGALNAGAALVLLDRFEPAGTLEAIVRHGVTMVVGAPALFAALTAAADAAEANPTTSIRLAVSGAAPLPVEVADRWQRRFGLPLRQGYGLTEAAPVVSAERADRPARRISVGVTVPGVEVRLVDDDGEEALAGDPGEVWVRGPNVFPGYWRDEAATEAVLSADGWLRTGDIAVVSDDGELSIVDRAKDLIIVSGFNVYPAEVEEVLAEHPAVSDTAVVGEDDPTRGEAVHAFVVLDPEQHNPSKADLDAWCAARLARYKCPTVFSFVPTLPHGLAGKLLRRSLRADQAAAR